MRILLSNYVRNYNVQKGNFVSAHILPENAHFAVLGRGIVKRGELCNNLKIDISINIGLERLKTGTSKSL